jgi:hypothetical protein
MTHTQLEHLRLIDAHLERLLELAAKRTPGEWTVNKDRNWETYSVEADDTVCDFFYLSEETHHRHPFQEGNEENNAAYIASCAGNAEAGWRATRAVIEFALMVIEFHSTRPKKDPQQTELETVEEVAMRILAAFPLETLK